MPATSCHENLNQETSFFKLERFVKTASECATYNYITFACPQHYIYVESSMLVLILINGTKTINNGSHILTSHIRYAESEGLLGKP